MGKGGRGRGGKGRFRLRIEEGRDADFEWVSAETVLVMILQGRFW